MWVISHGARMTAAAGCRLQGLEFASLAVPSSDKQLRELMGNAMILSVVERLLRAGFIAAGLLDAAVADRWATGQAQFALVRDAWGSSIPGFVFQQLPDNLRGLLYADVVTPLV